MVVIFRGHGSVTSRICFTEYLRSLTSAPSSFAACYMKTTGDESASNQQIIPPNAEWGHDRLIFNCLNCVCLGTTLRFSHPSFAKMAPKIVVVTGCSTGIGLSTSLLLANDKNKRFKVYATMRNVEKKGELEEQGKDVLGDTLMIKAMDVCSDDSVNTVVQELLAAHQKIDIVSKYCDSLLYHHLHMSQQLASCALSVQQNHRSKRLAKLQNTRPQLRDINVLLPQSCSQ